MWDNWYISFLYPCGRKLLELCMVATYFNFYSFYRYRRTYGNILSKEFHWYGIVAYLNVDIFDLKYFKFDMMNKTLYYFSLVLAWIVIEFFLMLFWVLLGISGVHEGLGFGYKMGAALAHPQLWIIALGFVLLLRPSLYKAIMKTSKVFNKNVAVLCLVLGFIWLLLNIAGRLISNNV